MDFTLCLTHACNLRCRYCYAGEKHGRRMSREVAGRAIQFFIDHVSCRAQLTGKPPESSQLGFFGGEPLLEWDTLVWASELAGSLATAAGIPLVRTVTTNMTLLDDAKVDWLKSHGFHVGLSLDGNARMHDTLRRTTAGLGSHADSARALRHFTGTGVRAEVIVVMDPANIQFLGESIEWLIDQDVRQISLNPNFNAGWTEAALAEWRRQYQRAAHAYANTFRAGRPVNINVFHGKIRLHVKGGYVACDQCGFGTNEVAVSARGNFYPCERVVGNDDNEDLRIGNVIDGFDNARRAALAGGRGNTTPECAACPVRSRCMNWCACANLASTGRIDQAGGALCFHEQLAMDCADAVAAELYAEENPWFLATFYSEQ